MKQPKQKAGAVLVASRGFDESLVMMTLIMNELAEQAQMHRIHPGAFVAGLVDQVASAIAAFPGHRRYEMWQTATSHLDRLIPERFAMGRETETYTQEQLSAMLEAMKRGTDGRAH